MKMENEDMKIIKPSVEFFGAVPTEYNATLKFIEMAGRTCYKSEDKITEDSAEEFVKKLIKAGHLAMVEHSNFVVRGFPIGFEYDDHVIAAIGKYLTFRRIAGVCYIGGSLTAWYQNAVTNGLPSYTDAFIKSYGALFDIPTDLIGISDWQPCPHDEIPKELHRYSAKFICDRGVSHELVRHRPCSFAQESTRYVNYGGKDMEFIEPNGFAAWSFAQEDEFLSSCAFEEKRYNRMLWLGLKPQQARAVLPNALKTEIIITADAAEWSHIRKLRTAKSAHPDMQRVMSMMPWEEFLDNQMKESKIHRCKKHHKDFTGRLCPNCKDEDSDNTTAYHEG